MATQWPVLNDRLVSLLPSLPSWSQVPVYDGPPVTGDVPTEFCTVGYAQLEDSAGSWETDRAGNGFQIEESGSVRCELVLSSGDTVMPALRSRGFALLDELEAAIREDQRLGVLPPASTTNLVVDVVPAQTTAGAVQRFPFSVVYFTRS